MTIHVWKDASGKKVTGKEFIERFKAGVEKATPLQQAKAMFPGYFIILAGICFGLVSTALMKTWWLFIILVGSLIISLVQLLGAYQKYLILKRIDKLTQEVQQSGEDTNQK
jgi:type III secretory pathway component EscU